MQRVVRQRVTVCAVLAIAVAAIGPGGLVATTPAEATARSADEAVVEDLLTRMHNDARQQPGNWTDDAASPTSTIVAWTDLRDVARSWSDFQADRRCPGGAPWCHNYPSNGGEGFSNEVCCHHDVRENVVWVSWWSENRNISNDELEAAAAALMRWWMNSPGHRDTILQPHWDDMGVSAAIRTVPTGHGYQHDVHATGLFRQRASGPPGSSYPSGANHGVDRDASPGNHSDDAGVLEPRSIDHACPQPPTAAFPDVAVSSAAGHAVSCIADLGITHGADDGTFRPSQPVTRDQMASFIVRLLQAAGVQLDRPGTAPFNDVAGNTHAEAIAALAEAGVAAGYGDGAFGPRDAVTRAQMATFLVRAHTLAAPGTLTDPDELHAVLFFDDVAGSPHTDAINQLAADGITAGRSPGRYGPGDEVTRAQMAMFIARTLDSLAMSGVWRP
jgi:hypothetical protein